MDVINRKGIFRIHYFHMIMSTSVVLLLMNNCKPPQPRPDSSDFYISGTVYDECGEDELPVEGVKIMITSNYFKCSGIVTDEDGRFIIDSNGCSSLKDYIESLEAGAFIDPSFDYPYVNISWEDYDLGYEHDYQYWKRMQWDDLELSFECDECDGCCDIETGETKCEPGQECINRECCTIPPPGFYSDRCNGPLLKKPPEDTTPSVGVTSETVIIIEKCDECVSNILVDEMAEGEGYFLWDKDERELVIPQKKGIEREVVIMFIIGDEEEDETFTFIDGANKNMIIEWNGINFVSNWLNVKN